MSDEEIQARAIATLRGIPIGGMERFGGIALISVGTYNAPKSFPGSFTVPWSPGRRRTYAQMSTWAKALAAVKTYDPTLPA